MFFLVNDHSLLLQWTLPFTVFQVFSHMHLPWTLPFNVQGQLSWNTHNFFNWNMSHPLSGICLSLAIFTIFLSGTLVLLSNSTLKSLMVQGMANYFPSFLKISETLLLPLDKNKRYISHSEVASLRKESLYREIIWNNVSRAATTRRSPPGSEL